MNYYCFDLGNVIVDCDIERFEKALPNKFKNHYHYLIDEVYHNQYEIGLINFKQICRHVFDKLGHLFLETDIQEITNSWNEVILFDQEMLYFIEKLSQNNKIGLLSNIGQEHAKYILEKCPQLKASSQITHHFSYQVGARKPTKLFYQSFLLEKNSFYNSVFFDDKPENVEMAKNMYLNAYSFSLKEFKKLNQNNKDEIKEMIIDLNQSDFSKYPEIFSIGL